MRSRFPDESGSRWRTILKLSGSSVRVHFLGFSAYTGTLQESGWDFTVVKNNFTKRSKVFMRNSIFHLVGSGDFVDGFDIHIRQITQEKLLGKPRFRTSNEIINFDELEITDLLNAIAEKQKSEAPQKLKPRAEIISMRETA